MRSIRLLLPLALLALTAGCATTGGAGRGPGAATILPRATTDAFLSELDGRLKAVGFETERAGDILRAEHDRTYAWLISYDDVSNRMVHIAFFDMQPGLTCATVDVQTAIAESNRRFNVGKFYCDTDDDTVGYEAALLVPERGIEAKELRTYLMFLSQQMPVVSRESGLYDLLK